MAFNKLWRPAILLSILSIPLCFATANAGDAIAEMSASPTPAKNADLAVLQDGKTSQMQDGQVQWDLSSHMPYKQVQLDLALKPGLSVKKVALHANQRIAWGVSAPSCVQFKGSADGRDWQELGSSANTAKLPDTAGKWYEIEIPAEKAEGLAYVRIIVQIPQKADKFSCIWVDEVAVTAEKSKNGAAQAQRPLVRNYVANGSFEINNVMNVPDFWHVKAYAYYLDRAAILDVYSDSSTAYLGKHSLCIDSTAHKGEFEANPVYVRQGLTVGKSHSGKFTLSFYAKASDDGVQLTATLEKSRATFKLRKDWEKFTIQANQAGGDARLLQFEMTPVKNAQEQIRTYQGGRKIWIDAVQVENGESASSYVDSYLDAAAMPQPEADFVHPELTPVKIEDGKMSLGSFFANPAAMPKPSTTQFHRLRSAELVDDTAVYLLNDSENLYICFQAKTQDGAVPQASVKKDDGPVYIDDAVEFFIQPDSNKQDCYHYAINCEGAVFDAFYQSGPITSWNAPFKKAVSKTNGLWTAEIAIPLKWLENCMGDGDIRFNICRGSRTSWAPVQNKFMELERFGNLKGLDFLKRKPTLAFGPFAVNYKLETGVKSLTLPLSNETAKQASFTVKTAIQPMNATKDKELRFERAVTLPPHGKADLEIALPEGTRGYRNVETVATDENGRSEGRSFQSALFMDPIALRTAKLVIKNEEIKAEPVCRFDAKQKFTCAIALKDNKGATLFERRTDGCQTAKFSSDSLSEGRHSIEMTIVDAAGSTLLETSKSIYVSGKVPSWSRVNPDTKELVVNGKSIIPIGVYYMPPDGMECLKDSGFNMCTYRTEWVFDPKRCLNFLDQAGKNGISVLIETSALTRAPGKTEAELVAKLDEIVACVKNHPAYAGMHVCDEPNALQTELMSPAGLARFYKHLEEVDPTHISLFVTAGTQQYACDSEDLICYDHYATVTGPFTRNLRDNNTVLKTGVNMASFFDKPIWRCLEGNEGCFPNLIRQPSVDEWRVLVFSTFATGGNGIMLYGGIPAFTSLREPYAKAIKEMRDIAPYLVRGEKSSKVELESKDDILWRAADCDGKTVALIVNLDAKPTTFTLRVKGGASAIRDMLSSNATPTSFTLWIKSGANAIRDMFASNATPQAEEMSFTLPPYGVMAFEIKPK